MDLAREVGDLLEQIRLGEDSRFEFKRVEVEGGKVRSPNAESLCQEIAAFANSRGGTLVLGVDDKTRDILGIPLGDLDLVELTLANLVRDRIDPEPTIYTRKLALPDREGEQRPVLVVEVPASLFVHDAPGGYFRRQGSAKHKMTPQELQRLFQSRARAGTIAFDEQPVPRCGRSDMKPELYTRFFGDSSDTPEVKMRKLKLLVAADGAPEAASVAGCLMATDIPEQWLPNAYVQAVRYRGIEKNADQQEDALDFRGPLDAQIIAATGFVLHHMHIGARKHLGRIDIPQYDVQAVFEAIANAVAHRDYSIAGSPVQVHQFADRLEITSPGALPNSQTIDSIPLRTATRNELTANLLARCSVEIEGLNRRTILEKRGEGVPLILKRSEALSGRAPRFELLADSALKLTIYAADPATSPLGETLWDPLRFGTPTIGHAGPKQ